MPSLPYRSAEAPDGLDLNGLLIPHPLSTRMDVVMVCASALEAYGALDATEQKQLEGSRPPQGKRASLSTGLRPNCSCATTTVEGIDEAEQHAEVAYFPLESSRSAGSQITAPL